MEEEKFKTKQREFEYKLNELNHKNDMLDKKIREEIEM
jgi:hypothetical protein